MRHPLGQTVIANRHAAWIPPALTVALIAAALTGLLTGPAPITPTALLSLWASDTPAATRLIVLDLRLPRVLTAVLVGGVLATTGAALQALFRNPLAEPGLIGVSGGGAVGAVALLVLAPALAAAHLVPLAAFVGALATVWLVTSIARQAAHGETATLLLAGIAVNAVVGAAVGLLTYLADDRALRSLTFWLFGDVGRADWTALAIATPLMLLPGLWLLGRRRDLNVLMLGHAEAGHLGVNVLRLRRGVLIATALAVGAAVAITGMIAFVGLIVPHLVRLLCGPDLRRLMPAAALAGALLLVVGDIAARVVVAPAELPVGVLTALVGGPFFLMMLIRRTR